jgi:hypothetical protein
VWGRGASRTKSEISCSQGKFFCSGLDPSALSLRRVKAQALRGNKNFPACRGSFESKPSLLSNDPRLEALLRTTVWSSRAELRRCLTESLTRRRCPQATAHRSSLSYCHGSAVPVLDAARRGSVSQLSDAEKLFCYFAPNHSASESEKCLHQITPPDSFTI